MRSIIEIRQTETYAKWFARMEDGDPDLLLAVLGDIAKAKGMTQLARDTGLGRESLYKALTPGEKPRFDTVMKVIQGMGVHLRATARLMVRFLMRL